MSPSISPNFSFDLNLGLYLACNAPSEIRSCPYAPRGSPLIRQIKMDGQYMSVGCIKFF